MARRGDTLALHITCKRPKTKMVSKFNFQSGKDMLKVIQSGVDLYCKELGIYVFCYNDAGSICWYYIDAIEAKTLQRKAVERDEYWAAFLGFGGHIVDDPDCEFYRANRQTNIEWCKEMYKHHWIPTEAVNISTDKESKI